MKKINVRLLEKMWKKNYLKKKVRFHCETSSNKVNTFIKINVDEIQKQKSNYLKHLF